jgi:hypothetical protein
MRTPTANARTIDQRSNHTSDGTAVAVSSVDAEPFVTRTDFSSASTSQSEERSAM